MEPGFVKADSRNLPDINHFMVVEFFAKSDFYVSAEIRAVKNKSYGEDAVGYVCIKTIGQETTVVGKVTPEHKVNNPPYRVSAVIDNCNRVIVSAQCEGCKAQKGGCKHTIAFIFWLLRRSEEDAVTDVKCYWQKPALSNVRNLPPFRVSDEEQKLKTREPQVQSDAFRQEAANMLIQRGLPVKAQALKLMGLASSSMDIMYLDHLVDVYLDTTDKENTSYASFLALCKDSISEADCNASEVGSREQKDSPMWHHLRFGRVTASRLYEVAQCHTADGSLVESILCAAKFKGTAATKRGNALEARVLAGVATHLGEKCSGAGLFLKKEWAIFGASPDAVIRDSDGGVRAVVEVKCPASQSTVGNYIKSGAIAPKVRAQLQLQMLLADCCVGYLAVASPDFESTGSIYVCRDTLCESFLLPLMKKAERFWYTAVYPQLAAGRQLVPQ
ncbi:uncharacterized protein LOC122381929 isoform X2 [Amphibalanus amphitrite]|uniref:uncharacterized protein LOC122381929 isoform X2 n=1 Tax=Amphibalanus amphitrite TaxID=1232801 RepID=UPI001C9232C6|nr:uncharacterized protein LOC122381929 isoform X2 [Amphibalanus amphitrite]